MTPKTIPTKEQDFTNWIFFIAGLILVANILYYTIYFSYQSKEPDCSYPKDIAIQKMQFDFLNTAYNGSLSKPYTPQQADFIIANKYVECKK